MKSTKIKLKLSDRLDIIKYVYMLKCTLAVRCAIDSFVDMIQPSDAEMQKGEVHFKDGYPFVDNDFTVDFDIADVPPAITEAINSYMAELEMASKNSENLQKTYNLVKSTLGLVVADE